MTLAAFAFQNSDIRILELSLKYGYDSPTSFSRAFQGVHGMPPSSARKKGARLIAYPKLTICITVKGSVEMQHKIEEKEAFRIVGMKEKLSMDVEKNFQTVPKFWETTIETPVISQLTQINDFAPKGILGITADFKEGPYLLYCSSQYPSGARTNAGIENSKRHMGRF